MPLKFILLINKCTKIGCDLCENVKTVVSSLKGCLFVLKRLTILVSLIVHAFVLFMNLIVKGVISANHDNMYRWLKNYFLQLSQTWGGGGSSTYK